MYGYNFHAQTDSNGYFDDPWYLAIFTAWLDDWYLGGDIDYPDPLLETEKYDRQIGGYSCSGGEPIQKTLGEFECEGEWVETADEVLFSDLEYGIFGRPYGSDANNQKAKIEKGSGADRSFTSELKTMIYNVGFEYWYTDNFALRAGYIYDNEGKVINPTFGAGIRLLQYGFDFGYTAGEQGHPRANTMFFSINMKL